MCHGTAMQQDTYNDMLKVNSHIRISNIVKKVLTNQSFDDEDFSEAVLGKFYIASISLLQDL